MKVFSIAKGFHKVWKDSVENDLSEKERNRLRAITVWQRSRDAGLVCDTFGVSRATLYRWIKRFDPKDTHSLKERSRRPHRVRKPEWPWQLAQTVQELREQYPRWGKDKLAVLLARKGWHTSVSTVGRILTDLKKRGCLIEPKTRALSSRRRRLQRPYAVRKPKEYRVSGPGDLVQVDVLDIRPVPAVILKQFTARDMVSRWDVLEVRSSATAKTAEVFLRSLKTRMPFTIKAIQVDGGGEFCAEFEEACKAEAIHLYVLPPKSPKLNSHVERANRTHTEEFYEVYPTSWTVADLNKELLGWEYTYNCVRPHQSLAYRTPLQFLQEHGIVDTAPTPPVSHM